VTGAELDIGPMVVWVAALASLLSFGTSIWALLTSGARKNENKLAELQGKVDEVTKEHSHRADQLERRMDRAETNLAQMPNLEMMHRLELSLTRMSGNIDKLDEKLKPVAAIAERMQEVMIEQSRQR